MRRPCETRLTQVRAPQVRGPPHPDLSGTGHVGGARARCPGASGGGPVRPARTAQRRPGRRGVRRLLQRLPRGPQQGGPVPAVAGGGIRAPPGQDVLRATTPAINLLPSGPEHDLEDVQAAKDLMLRRKVSNRRSAICTPQYRARAQSRTNPRALARSSASSTSRQLSAASRVHGRSISHTCTVPAHPAHERAAGSRHSGVSSGWYLCPAPAPHFDGLS